MHAAAMQMVADAADWSPAGKPLPSNWTHVLQTDEIDALVDQTEIIRRQIGEDPKQLLALDRRTLLAATAGQPWLDRIYGNLREGCGLALIRGLPIDKLDRLSLAIIYWTIGNRLGEARPNNPEGDMIGHITDLGKTQSDPHSRGYQTREAMDYHCDQCDIVGLLCVRSSKSGGLSKVASSVAVYNELLAHYPHYAELLTGQYYWTKHGEHAAGESPFYQSAVFNFLQGKLCTSFGPKHIIKGHRLPGAPALREDQRMALQTMENIAEQLHVSMELQPGDIQLLNNYVTLHTRTAFVDYPSVERRRLLWRLWLMNPDIRPRTGYTTQWLNGVSSNQTQAVIRL